MESFSSLSLSLTFSPYSSLSLSYLILFLNMCLSLFSFLIHPFIYLSFQSVDAFFIKMLPIHHLTYFNSFLFITSNARYLALTVESLSLSLSLSSSSYLILLVSAFLPFLSINFCLSLSPFLCAFICSPPTWLAFASKV